jgi:hypothetical protein
MMSVTRIVRKVFGEDTTQYVDVQIGFVHSYSAPQNKLN